MKRMFSHAAGASALGVALAIATVPGVAHAAVTKCAYDDYDRACATNNDNYTSSMEVCDNEDDGRSVTAWFGMSNGLQRIVTDTYGGGCKVSTSDIRVAWFQMAENGGAMSATVYMY